jgi:transposase-like protein
MKAEPVRYVLTKEERNRVIALVRKQGASSTARALGVSREALARAVGGVMSVRHGTLVLLRQNLNQMKKSS